MKIHSLVFMSAMAVAVPAIAQEPPPNNVPTVMTVGRSTIMAVPDRAFVTVAAESRSRSSNDAQRQNADAMTAVMQKLAAAGVPKDAIRTVAYDLQPEFDFSSGRQVLRGYVARNTIEVRVDDIAKVGSILDAAGGGGATSIGGIRFDVRERAAVERDALRQAVADARARADAAAAGAGRTIDRIIRIQEEGAPEYPRPMQMIRADMAAAAPTPIVPSTIEIQARVTLTAALK